jgi:hypothetical protein
VIAFEKDAFGVTSVSDVAIDWQPPDLFA